jgi:hypothetical protein
MEPLTYDQLLEILNYYKQRAVELELTSVETQVRSRTITGQLHDLNAEFQKMVDNYENKLKSEKIEEPTTKGQTKNQKSD